jgi:hypothetical protein
MRARMLSVVGRQLSARPHMDGCSMAFMTGPDDASGPPFVG